MDILLSTLVSGLILSSLYALMASGLSVIWTTLGVFNFAHGLLMTVCAYITWHFAVYLEWGLFIGACIGLLAVAGIGVLMERWLVRPFYKYSNMLLVTVMTSLACMTILEKTIHLIWGARLKRLPKVAEGDVSVFGVIISAPRSGNCRPSPCDFNCVVDIYGTYPYGTQSAGSGTKPSGSKTYRYKCGTGFFPLPLPYRRC